MGFRHNIWNFISCYVAGGDSVLVTAGGGSVTTGSGAGAGVGAACPVRSASADSNGGSSAGEVSEVGLSDVQRPIVSPVVSVGVVVDEVESAGAGVDGSMVEPDPTIGETPPKLSQSPAVKTTAPLFTVMQ